MNSVSGNPNGSSAYALHAAVRSRTVFISLLALQTIAVTCTLPAQAATERYGFYLTPSGDTGLDRVCVGDSVVFNVIAERRFAKQGAGALPDGDEQANASQQIAGVTINGSLLNPGYGTLKPATSTTSTRSKPPGSAAFTFAARRPGSTQLRFTGLLASAPLKSVGRTYTPFSRAVRVVACDSPAQPAIGSSAGGGVPVISKNRRGDVNNFKEIKEIKVTTRSTWSAGMDIVATIKDGVMVADDQGHFTGSANVTWWTSVIGSAGCGAAEYTVPPSKANLAGEFDESHRLVVTITFEPRDFAGFATCGPSSISTSNLATLDPLTVSVPATGGTSTQAHSVTAKNGSFAGSATIVVTPERK